MVETFYLHGRIPTLVGGAKTRSKPEMIVDGIQRVLSGKFAGNSNPSPGLPLYTTVEVIESRVREKASGWTMADVAVSTAMIPIPCARSRNRRESEGHYGA